MDVTRILIILIISIPSGAGYNYRCGKNDNEDLVCICALKSLRIIVNCKDSGLNVLPRLSPEEIRRADLVIMSGTPYCGGGVSRMGRILCDRSEATVIEYTATMGNTGQDTIMADSVMSTSHVFEDEEFVMQTSFSELIPAESLLTQTVHNIQNQDDDADDTLTIQTDTPTTMLTDTKSQTSIDFPSVILTAINTRMEVSAAHNIQNQNEDADDSLTIQTDTPTTILTDTKSQTLIDSPTVILTTINTRTQVTAIHNIQNQNDDADDSLTIHTDTPTTILTDTKSQTLIDSPTVILTTINARTQVTAIRNIQNQNDDVDNSLTIQTVTPTAVLTDAKSGKQSTRLIIIINIGLTGLIMFFTVRIESFSFQIFPVF